MKDRIKKMSAAIVSFYKTINKDAAFNKQYFVLLNNGIVFPIAVYVGGGKSGNRTYAPSARVIFVAPASNRKSFKIADGQEVTEGFTVTQDNISWLDEFLPDEYVTIAKNLLDTVEKLTPNLSSGSKVANIF